MTDEELIADNAWRSNSDIAIELLDAAEDADHAGRKGDAKFMRLAAARLEALTQPSGKVSDEQVERACKAFLRTNGDPSAKWFDYEKEIRAALEAAQLPARPVVKPDTNALVIAAREIAYDFAVQEAMGKERSDALDKALEPFAGQVGWDDDLTSEGEAAKQARVEHFETPTLKELYEEAVKDVYRKPDAPQPAQPDLEVVAWRRLAPTKTGWAWRITDDARQIDALVALKKSKGQEFTVEPLVRLTDAQAHIAALTAKVEELDGECQQSMLDICRERQRAEIAEAERDRQYEENASLIARNAELEEALEDARAQIEALCSPLDVPDSVHAALGGQSNEA